MKLTKRNLMKIYSISEVGHGSYAEGFFTALIFFHKMISNFLRERNLLIEFYNYLAESKKKAKFQKPTKK